MDAIAAPPSFYQFGRRKRIHLVRHAQGMHNVESDKSRDPLTSFQFFDARLSPLGWQQVVDQRKIVRESGLLDKIEVVIVSPMSRTLETAVGIFGGEDQPDGLHVASWEESNVESRPPMVAYELCRERMGKYECDKRGSISQYRSRFPAVDFSLIEDEDEVLWDPNERETHESVNARAIKFLKWLWERKEKEIAVVSHGVFLQQAMIELIQNKNGYTLPLNNSYDPCSRFKNCEIRSVITFHESTMGLGPDSMICKQQCCGRIENEVRESIKDKVPVEEVEVVT
ncbi:phosphoglycerate mutase-like protein isoform X2 [Hibiscus syriacus]|nr:phosphoglycerate mutase-like protein isoform X2 [Hibiscus syriacus]